MDKFKILKKQPNNFINIILDDWRGLRLIFDTAEVRNCKNKCPQCPLYQLLQKNNMLNELYPASKRDKKNFGQQNFLNCKTIKQYVNCYINFLNKKCANKKQINQELALIKNARVIYSKENWSTKKFKTKIINKILKISNKNKKEIILSYLSQNKQFFT